MTTQPDLSVVIPVYNAAQSVEHVVNDLLALDAIHTEIVLVDDSSTDGSDTVLAGLSQRHSNVRVVSHTHNQGAGVARNTGFDVASGRYTLFFDADDVIHGDGVHEGIKDLDELGADAAVMRYRYRGGSVVRGSMHPYDLGVWDHHVGGRDRRLTSLDEAPQLLGFTNYPWNKIIRTESLRATGLRFGTTPVHNDILGHWHTLLFSESIVLVNAVICTHIVKEGGKNLTNQQARVRLTLFDALDQTYDLLLAHPNLLNRYSHHYWGFVLRLAAWGRGRISGELRNEFDARLRTHLLRCRVVDLARIRTKLSPTLADDMQRTVLA